MQEGEPSVEPSGEPSVDRAVRALVRLARLLERVDSGLSLSQFRILELVSRGTERSTHIATRLATSKPAISAVVDSLVGAGLLRRGTHQADRRVIRLEVTAQGRRTLRAAERAYAGRLTPLLAEISDAPALLAQLLEIDDALDARWTRAHPPAAPGGVAPPGPTGTAPPAAKAGQLRGSEVPATR